MDTVYVGKKLGLLVFPYMHQVPSGHHLFILLVSMSRLRATKLILNLRMRMTLIEWVTKEDVCFCFRTGK